jgi:hypothetical protein
MSGKKRVAGIFPPPLGMPPEERTRVSSNHRVLDRKAFILLSGS